MKSLNAYRFAGFAGGLMLAAGQFFGPACLLQMFALLPLMLLVLRDRRLSPAGLAGLYMGLAFTFPQMIYLRMPIPVTVILLFILRFCWLRCVREWRISCRAIRFSARWLSALSGMSWTGSTIR